MTIVMGLDQHRAKITAEWLDTSSGELSRARIAPADRAGVRRFAARFRGGELEVALEATTGWRFVVEELQAVGARCIWPRRRRPRRAAGPRSGPRATARGRQASARAVDGRPAAGILDPTRASAELRARVRLRHTLVDHRREWQQRMQATLYLLGDEWASRGARGLRVSGQQQQQAPMKKPKAPSAVHQFAAARSRIEPLEGTTWDAIADTPNGMHPTRFTAAIVQSGRTASPITPSTIMSPIRSSHGSRTEIRLGVRAPHPPTRTRPTMRGLDPDDQHR